MKYIAATCFQVVKSFGWNVIRMLVQSFAVAKTTDPALKIATCVAKTTDCGGRLQVGRRLLTRAVLAQRELQESRGLLQERHGQRDFLACVPQHLHLQGQTAHSSHQQFTTQNLSWCGCVGVCLPGGRGLPLPRGGNSSRWCRWSAKNNDITIGCVLSLCVWLTARWTMMASNS